jgi:hypothetical protein
MPDGVSHSEWRGTEDGDTLFFGQRRKVRHVAFVKYAHGFLNTVGENNRRDPQLCSRAVAPSGRNAFGKREYRSSVCVDSQSPSGKARLTLQQEEILSSLMGMQSRAVPGVGDDLYERTTRFVSAAGTQKGQRSPSLVCNRSPRVSLGVIVSISPRR